MTGFVVEITTGCGETLLSAHQTSTLHASLNSCVRDSARPLGVLDDANASSRETPRRMDAARIRRAVERVVDLYQEIEYFGIQAAALDPDTRISGGTASPAPERHARLWKSTVGRMLAALDRRYQRALERGAHLRAEEYRLGRDCTRLTRLLADPRRGSIPASRRGEANEVLELQQALYALIRTERERLERSAPYTEAAMLFWIECGERDERFPAEDIRRFIFDEVEKRKRRVS